MRQISPRVETDDAPPAGRWTVVIPFYNERDFICTTLDSLAQQTRPFKLILIDNGATDDSVAVIAAWAVQHPAQAVQLYHEPTPGQVHALKAGIAAVETEFVAICDADTEYPPHYLTRAEALFATDMGLVGALGHNAPQGAANATATVFKRWLYTHIITRLLSGQGHAGGYAHCYRTAALRAAGSYDAAIWPYVVKDHELIHRMLKIGRLAYATDLWCVPSKRRHNRRGVRWTLFERVVYHATPFAAKDWFFYKFLGPRLAARGQSDIVLRAQNWSSAGDE